MPDTNLYISKINIDGSTYNVKDSKASNVQFTKADTFEDIVSEENISTSFGKMSRWYNEIAKKIDTEATYTDIKNLFKPKPYLTFKGTDPFTLGTTNGGKWDGTVEYSTDLDTWTIWDGTTRLSSGEGNILCLRGKNNTTFATSNSTDKCTNFVLTTTGTIECNGDIRTLLDYENPENTTMANNCYYYMFQGCTSLTKAPELPATTLTTGCYYYMFRDCTSLTTSPKLPATTLTESCYDCMFQGCTSLTKAPELPATTLASDCYSRMFQGCTSLTKAPELPATTLADHCYEYMFYGCTSLTAPPELPATRLANYCYKNMFQGCTSLIEAPALPATSLGNACYANMFQDCTSLTEAPALPATSLGNACYSGMFYGCTSLTEAPALPATSLTEGCYGAMFRNCTSLTTLPALPATRLVDICYMSMFLNCTNIKISTTQTGDYQTPYRIPVTGTGTDSTAQIPLANMFGNTGGTFTGTPTINTTYYTSNTVVSAS